MFLICVEEIRRMYFERSGKCSMKTGDSAISVTVAPAPISQVLPDLLMPFKSFLSNRNTISSAGMVSCCCTYKSVPPPNNFARGFIFLSSSPCIFKILSSIFKKYSGIILLSTANCNAAVLFLCERKSLTFCAALSIDL